MIQPAAIKQTATTDTFFMSILDVTNFPTKFQISCWPLTTALCPAERNFSKGKKLPPTTNKCSSSLFSIKNNKNGSPKPVLSQAVRFDDKGWEARAVHGRWRVDDGPAEGWGLMSWWRLIMADHISDPSLVWAGSGQLRPVWSYELRDTVSPQLPGNPFRCPTTCRVIYN